MFMLHTIVRAALVCLMVSAPAAANDGIATIEGLLDGKPAEASQFSESFLAQVPIAQLNQILAQTLLAIGAPKTVAASVQAPGLFFVDTASYRMPIYLTFDENAKVSGLLFKQPLDRRQTLSQLAAGLGALGERTSLLVRKDGKVLQAIGADTPLAVGSAFKLGVLAVLEQDFDAGRRAIDDVVTFDAAARSLPSGILQTFPAGAPLTLHTLATMMISLSDNTATDLLIQTLGRDAIAQKLGLDFLLKTREFFQLKGDDALRKRFTAADPAGKQALMTELATAPLPDPNVIGPLDDGAEWYLSTQKLCDLIAEVAGLDYMVVTSGPVLSNHWTAVAFKGGSEIGVLNYTSQLTAPDGSHTCLSMTINAHRALDEATATTLYQAIALALETAE